jgi:hypothetical protein
METKQPVWKKIGTVGDVNPLDYAGGFIYEDETGVYPAELEYVARVVNGARKVYRWPLDRCETVTADEKTLLVPFGYPARTDLPHPLADYDEWFNSNLESAASFADRTVEDFRAALCSEDARTRALAYLALAQNHGFENFDSYPVTFTSREELEARYKSNGPAPKLNTETNTPAMEARILKAVKKALVNPARRYAEFRAFFEHGQWWIEHLPSGAQWSVCDASGPSCPDGFDFEEVTQGSAD